MENNKTLIHGSSSMTNVRACMNDSDDEKMENEDNDYIASDEEDDDDDDDSYIDDSEEDECVDWSVVFPPETFCFVNTSVGAIAKTTPTTAADFQDEIYEDSDYLHTPPESEYEEPINNYPTFKMGDGSIGVQFQLGLTFNNKKQAQEAIKEYAMETRKSLHLQKNELEPKRISCKETRPKRQSQTCTSKRQRSAPESSSRGTIQQHDASKFKSTNHEWRYSQLEDKQLIPEKVITLQYASIGLVIKRRGWGLLSQPERNIDIDIVRELYANAYSTEGNSIESHMGQRASNKI